MSAPGAKAKVRVADLITAVEQARAAKVKEHAAAVERYNRGRDAITSKVERALLTALDNLTAGKLPHLDDAYRWNRKAGRYDAAVMLPLSAPVPEEPEPVEEWTSKIDHDLGLLRRASQEFFMVGRDDFWSSYLKGARP